MGHWLPFDSRLRFQGRVYGFRIQVASTSDVSLMRKLKRRTLPWLA